MKYSANSMDKTAIMWYSVFEKYKLRLESVKMPNAIGYGSDTALNTSKSYLEIIDCGVSRYNFDKETVVSHRGRDYFQFIYVKQGKFTAEVIDKTVEIREGNVLIYHPGEAQKYHYSVKTSCETVWFHFSGSVLREVLVELGIYEDRVFHFNKTDEIEFLLSKLLPEHRLKYRGYKISQNALLQQILCQLSRGADNINHPYGEARQKLERVLIKMENDIKENFTLADYAAEIHLSVDRFSHLFTETMGVSPHRYILDLKINKAKQLFRQTDLNVREVAEFVGISDPLYFSRLFKKQAGVTPTDYRNENNR